MRPVRTTGMRHEDEQVQRIRRGSRKPHPSVHRTRERSARETAAAAVPCGSEPYLPACSPPTAGSSPRSARGSTALRCSRSPWGRRPARGGWRYRLCRRGRLWGQNTPGEPHGGERARQTRTASRGHGGSRAGPRAPRSRPRGPTRSPRTKGRIIWP